MKTVVNILNTLNNGNNFIYDIKEYETIGDKVVDNFNLFNKYEEQDPTPFKLIPHASRSNLTVQIINYGSVKINPIQAKREGIDSKFDNIQSYNNKTIIKDGILNVNKIKVLVDQLTYLKLKKMDVEMKELDNKNNGRVVEIILSEMPIINNYNPNLENILNNNKTLLLLTAKKQVLKYLKESKNDLEEIFNDSQIQLINDHGLDNKMRYKGVDLSSEATEEYESKIINFKIKNSSSGSINKILEKVENGKKLNKLEVFKYDYYKYVKQYGQQFIENELINLDRVITQIKIINVIDKINLFNIKETIKYDDLTIDFKIETNTR